MRNRADDQDFEDLSLSEKILHVQDLWDQIADSADEIDLTDEQREELERRLQAHEDYPGSYVTWEELRARLERLVG